MLNRTGGLAWLALRRTVTLLRVAAVVTGFVGSTAQAQPAGPRAETYQAAAIDAAGRLVITTADNKTIVIPKEGEQSSFSRPVLSSARTAVGAQAEFPNCCTSYDIPLQLVIYANGKVHRFTGIGLMIFRWHFADGGTRVAFGQETVHFSCETHYELRDIQSERLIESSDIPQSCGQNPDPEIPKAPKWVDDLRATGHPR